MQGGFAALSMSIGVIAVFLLTGGGPVTSTQTLPLLVYKQAFALNEMGGASAVAVLMMLFMLGFMLWYFRYSKASEG